MVPDFCSVLSSLFHSFLLEGWSGIMVISKFICKVEPGFSHLAKTPRICLRGCIQLVTEMFPDLLWESCDMRPSQSRRHHVVGIADSRSKDPSPKPPAVLCLVLTCPLHWSELPWQVFGLSTSLCSPGRG